MKTINNFQNNVVRKILGRGFCGLVLLLLCFSNETFAQSVNKFSIEGQICVSETKTPIGFATVSLPEANLWAVADNNGHFSIKNIREGTYTINIACLGYETKEFKLNVNKNYSGSVYYLVEQTLAINEVVVTAKENKSGISTSRKIDKAAIDHMQMLNVADISTLLPDGKTVNSNLAENANTIAIRSGGADVGNAAAFGTAIEVNGVRLSNNGSLDDIGGIDTRNIASSNVESVEVISGIPSVEYGDMTNGVVIVKTKKGRTPWTATFATNPKTKQFSVDKGFDLGGNNGIINANLEYVRAVKNTVSPYYTYTRRILDLNYSNTFNKKHSPLNFSMGFSGNIGGINNENDPDLMLGTWEKKRANSFRLNTNINWLLNKSWITSLEFSGAVNYADNLLRSREYYATANNQPAITVEGQGYFVSGILPKTYYAVNNVDSKPINYTANLKANLSQKIGDINNKIKAGLGYNASGNLGDGEFYNDGVYQNGTTWVSDNSLVSQNGYRPYSYKDIPFMHTFSGYVEDNFTMNLNDDGMKFDVMAGLRAEKTYIQNSDYKNTLNFSPRFYAKYTIFSRGRSKFFRMLNVRGGWGITEKLPSFNILYPRQQYRDVQTFSASYGSSQNLYVYHTTPYSVEYNENLKWMRNNNTELGIEANFGGVNISLTGFYEKTKYPYELKTTYEPFSYKVSAVPSGYTIPTNPGINVDSNTGSVYIYDKDNPAAGATLMDTKVVNQTFVQKQQQGNSAPITRKGLEWVVDFGQIKSLRTSFRLDGSYTQTKYVNDGLYYLYNAGMTHTSLPDRSYQYVGIYMNDNNGRTGTNNGKRTRRANANLTITTHIPSVRLIISLRIEALLYYRTQNISKYQGEELAFNTSESGTTPTAGNIYDGNSYVGMYPTYYMDLGGNIYQFTQAQANDPAFANLILHSGNAYQYNKDGYNPYFSANISVTKEIGKIASISFYANNFTNTRKSVTYKATGVQQILVPDFYYGLSLRLKF